ncbi:MAG TPA: LLM class flavin-dependent oxidoreductase, partial [Acetobacteraceae bacterium]|nr:LLM class flavin-dependent oxidoreductase [Acetobacteraceae bacterium]
MIRLSVLDQSTVVTGRSPDTSIRESIRLAQHCEALGYARYWCAEHHNSDSQAGTAPEILIAAIAATTSRIRVGSAGVMLPHYSSLKVAEQFRVLDAIAPGRIDLGLGRAPGSDGMTAYALNPQAETAAEHFPAAVRDLLAWLKGERLIEGHPFREIRAQPGGPTVPEVWILGSSDYGAQVAAYFGLPFCFAHFITDGRGAGQALALYREGYRPSERHPQPLPAVCVWALAAETEAEAARLFTSREMWRLGRDRGVFTALPSPEEAAAYVYTDGEQARIERLRARALYGTPATVGAKLRALAATLDVEEVAILTTLHDPEARRRSYT